MTPVAKSSPAKAVQPEQEFPYPFGMSTPARPRARAWHHYHVMRIPWSKGRNFFPLVYATYTAGCVRCTQQARTNFRSLWLLFRITWDFIWYLYWTQICAQKFCGISNCLWSVQAVWLASLSVLLTVHWCDAEKVCLRSRCISALFCRASLC